MIVGDVRYKVELSHTPVMVDGVAARAVCDHRGRRLIINTGLTRCELEQVLKSAARKISRHHHQHSAVYHPSELYWFRQGDTGM